MIRKVDVSHKTIFFITAFLLLLWVVYLILDIILLLFVAFIFVSALDPLVNRLVGWRIPRSLAAAAILIGVAALIIGLLTISFTPILNQTTNLSQALGQTVNSLVRANLVDQNTIQNELSNFSKQAISITLVIFQNIIAFATLIVITFYLLLDKARLEGVVISFFVGHQDIVKNLFDRIQEKLGAWLRGQLLLSLIIGVVVYVGLTLLGIKYALPLAILAGLFEIVPVIGPIIASVPAVLLGLSVSPLLAALVAGFYLVVQQVENQVIVPQVMKRAVGLNPILVILSVSIGGRLLGIPGALLAVPIAVVIQVIAEGLLEGSTSSPA
ncbi:MAG: AI-2E family transporter [Candidatus Daviesbacteria bacterium]|nr:AI-2E family transporter [Candidatus Daviesbacteria bacterium]